MTVKHDCSGKIWGAYRDVSGRVYKCHRNATVERNGKWYCWQHDPNRVAADAEKRHAIEKAKMDRKAARYTRIARNARLAALVTPDLVALLERLAYTVGNVGHGVAKEAFILAASIREALALEANDES